MNLTEDQALRWEAAVSKALAIYLNEAPIDDKDYISNAYTDGLISLDQIWGFMEGERSLPLSEEGQTFLKENLQRDYEELKAAKDLYKKVAFRHLYKRQKFG